MRRVLRESHTRECTFTFCSQQERKSHPMLVWTGMGMGPSSSVYRGYSSRWNPLPTSLGSQCQGRQQGQGSAPSVRGDTTPTPGFGSGGIWARRIDSQHLRSCVCNALKRHWKKDGASKDWFLPLWGKLSSAQPSQKVQAPLASSLTMALTSYFSIP